MEVSIEEIKVESQEYKAYKSYEEFQDDLHKHECEHNSKYVIVRGSRHFARNVIPEDIIGDKAPRLLWAFHSKGDHLPMKFSGSPYMVLGVQEYQCHHGKDKHVSDKRRYRERKEERMKFDPRAAVTRKLAQDTKKLDCPVKFIVKKIFKFVHYRIDKDTKRRRSEMAKSIKDELKNSWDHKSQHYLHSFGELQYLCILPNPSDHRNHHIGEAAGISEPLDFRVSEYLKNEIRSGCRKTKELQERAAIFVKEKMLINENSPSSFSRRFKPSRKKLNNLITSVKVESRLSKTERTNVEALSDKWGKWADIHFESSTKKDIQVALKSEDWDESDIKSLSPNNKLIFIFQSPNMKRLYQRYGGELLLLEGTNKTTKHSLPLFFVVVKTNVNYQVVAVLVLQEESEELLVKSLQIIKSWSPNINPKYCMIDFDEKLIIALEEVFPGTSVFVCDFHREQAWSRWISKSENGVSGFANEAKTRLRRIALASDEDELINTLGDFMKWERFEGKLASWFTNIWRPEIRRWAVLYRPNDLLLTNTNNGTERLKRELKMEQIEDYKKCTLSEMLEVIVERFLPESYDRYVEMNIRYSNKYRRYDSNLPEYLENRPKSIIDWILSRQATVDDALKESVLQISDKIFSVKNDGQWNEEKAMYTVDFGDETNICSCTCPDFRWNRMPCKHFFCIIDTGLKQFADLSPLFRNHVWTTLDEELFEMHVEKMEYIDQNAEPVEIELEFISDNLEVISEVEEEREEEPRSIIEQHMLPTPTNMIRTQNPATIVSLAPKPLIKQKTSAKLEQNNLRSKLKELYDITYLMNDVSVLHTYNTQITALLNSAKSTFHADNFVDCTNYMKKRKKLIETRIGEKRHKNEY